MFQSLPRDSLLSNWRGLGVVSTMAHIVSIPPSGFSPFKLRRKRGERIFWRWFQSLPRDSLLSNGAGGGGGQRRRPGVSIPPSGFSPFKLAIVAAAMFQAALVSIPPSGFSPFKPARPQKLRRNRKGFQSLPRDSLLSNKTTRAATESPRTRFNPSLGILSFQTCATTSTGTRK